MVSESLLASAADGKTRMAEKSGGSVNWKCPNRGCGYVLPGEMAAMRFCPECKSEVKTQTPEGTGRPSSREQRNPAHASPSVAGDGGRESLGDSGDNVDFASALPGPSPGQTDVEAKTKQAGDPVPCGSQTSTPPSASQEATAAQAALQLLPPGRNTDETTHSDISTSANASGAQNKSPSGKASMQGSTGYKTALEETRGSSGDSENEEFFDANNGREEGGDKAESNRDGAAGDSAGEGNRGGSERPGIGQRKVTAGKHSGEGGDGGGGSRTTGSGVQKVVSFQRT